MSFNVFLFSFLLLDNLVFNGYLYASLVIHHSLHKGNGNQLGLYSCMLAKGKGCHYHITSATLGYLGLTENFYFILGKRLLRNKAKLSTVAKQGTKQNRKIKTD